MPLHWYVRSRYETLLLRKPGRCGAYLPLAKWGLGVQLYPGVPYVGWNVLGEKTKFSLNTIEDGLISVGKMLLHHAYNHSPSRQERAILFTSSAFKRPLNRHPTPIPLPAPNPANPHNNPRHQNDDLLPRPRRAQLQRDLHPRQLRARVPRARAADTQAILRRQPQLGTPRRHRQVRRGGRARGQDDARTARHGEKECCGGVERDCALPVLLRECGASSFRLLFFGLRERGC